MIGSAFERPILFHNGVGNVHIASIVNQPDAARTDHIDEAQAGFNRFDQRIIMNFQNDLFPLCVRRLCAFFSH
ncbi:hypothetical protein [Paenibacillus mesophilus]|uniref:hypothetical protein n=1 Tax=Paenibacillus mesophilus TaxID=2582849 RepID=UPI00192E7094|nr:hypothetical protein [Paenibacillus mesophilus]